MNRAPSIEQCGDAKLTVFTCDSRSDQTQRRVRMTDRTTPPLDVHAFSIRSDAYGPAVVCAAVALATVVALFAIIAK